MKRLKAKGKEVIVYEPTFKKKAFYNSKVTNDLLAFKKNTDLIIANRITQEIKDVVEKSSQEIYLDQIRNLLDKLILIFFSLCQISH